MSVTMTANTTVAWLRPDYGFGHNYNMTMTTNMFLRLGIGIIEAWPIFIQCYDFAA